MDIAKAKELLQTLSEGVNPLTGEVLSENDSCNQGEIVRALNVVLHQLENTIKPKRELPENAGKPWTDDEDKLLCKMFEENIPRKEIYQHFKRTSGAITSRLVRLGKITDKRNVK